MTDFDIFSGNYKKILNAELGFAGEDVDYFAWYKARRIFLFLGSSFRGRILDYGCGEGYVLEFLSSMFKNNDVMFCGYDVSEACLAQAMRRLPGVVLTPDLDRVKATDYDVLILANVIHHIAVEERMSFLRGLKDFLRLSGKIIVFEHNPLNPLTRHVVKNCVFDNDATLLRMREVISHFRAAEIPVIEKSYTVFFPKFLKSLRGLEPSLGWLPMGAQYMCVGVKG